MIEPKTRPVRDDAAESIYPEMPGYVRSDDELLAALAEGDADIEAGRTVAFEDVAAELRRNFGKA